MLLRTLLLESRRRASGAIDHLFVLTSSFLSVEVLGTRIALVPMRNEVLLRWESICIYFVDGIIPQGAQNLLNFVGVKPVALEDAAKLENCEILSRCGLK